MSSPERRAGRLPALAALLPTAAVLAACAVGGPSQPDDAAVGRYAIGRIPSDAEIRGWDIDIGPDGRNLPAGSGSVAQGRVLFARQCAACHGATGQGALMPSPLAGGAGSLTGKTPSRTIGSFWPHATTLYDYINRAMPWDRPQSLRPDEVYALTAFLLNLNGVVGADTTLDARALMQVKMPNRGGFVAWDNQPDLRVARCMSDCLK
jgi:cytochrome c